MPVVHRNQLNFIGIDIKSKYLIWHECAGTFTALHRESGLIKTWSKISGKYIGRETFDAKKITANLQNYSIYEQNSHDTLYKEDRY